MSIDKCPLSPVLVRFQEDLQLNRCGERTQQSYVRNLRKFSEYFSVIPIPRPKTTCVTIYSSSRMSDTGLPVPSRSLNKP